jgi:hypothetical protein
MKGIYYVGAGAAIVGAGCLLGLQVIGGLEHTAGASFYTVASTIAAMVTVALLPVFIHFATHISKTLAVVLTVGPDVEKECRIVGEECKRKRKTVQLLIDEQSKLNADLRNLGSARLGDIGSTTVAWALAGHVSEETIRKASPLGLVLGLETVIWGLVWLATAAIQTAWNMAPVRVAVQAITEREEPFTPDELEELRQILLDHKRKHGGKGFNNNTVADLIGVSPGESSKRVRDAAACGLVTKVRNGREVLIQPVEGVTVH